MKKFAIQYLSFLILLISDIVCHAQTIYYSTANTGIYEFLDEMANSGYIQVNSGVKPFSRKFIANKLNELLQDTASLNKRQLAELNFYLKDFNKEIKPNKNFDKRFDAFYYKDSLFALTINPVTGGYYFINSNGTMYQRWVGAEAFASIDNHWGVYASLRDYKESEPFSSPMFLGNRNGFKYKGDVKATDYSDMRGGITYNWRWGTIGFVKDQFSWGTNYNGANIFSGNAPSFAQIRMHLNPVRWFEFNYAHAWIISEVIDSSRIYRLNNRSVMPLRPKYLTANLFTFHPVKTLSLSFGNSIIYSDYEQPGYMIPVLFYKSVAHLNRKNSEMVNAQLFFDASARLFKHLHVYATWYIDEMSFGRMFDPSQHSNYFSIKSGMALDNLPLKNTKLIVEYTRTNPLVFQHNVATTTFESNTYNLGHYLRDNAEEIYTSFIVRPYYKLRIQGKFIYARKGKEYAGERTGEEWGQPFIANTDWKNRTIGFSARYQFMNDLHLSAEVLNTIYSGNPVYTASYFWGHQVTWILGLNYGF